MFPAISLGFTIFGEIFAYVTVFWDKYHTSAALFRMCTWGGVVKGHKQDSLSRYNPGFSFAGTCLYVQQFKLYSSDIYCVMQRLLKQMSVLLVLACMYSSLSYVQVIFSVNAKIVETNVSFAGTCLYEQQFKYIQVIFVGKKNLYIV